MVQRKDKMMINIDQYYHKIKVDLPVSGKNNIGIRLRLIVIIKEDYSQKLIPRAIVNIIIFINIESILIIAVGPNRHMINVDFLDQKYLRIDGGVTANMS